MNFTTLSPHELAKKLEIKELSSEEITKMYLERIKQHDSDIHAFFEVFDDVLDQARLVDHRRAQGDTSLDTFAGLPLAVKSLILVKGKKTTGGSRILENYVASYDATAIARLRKAGLVFMGTSNMDEFGMGSSTENSAFGTTKNPWKREKIPGGSSGGSAAAVAAGFVPLALGSDTGGSTRQPASLCGIVGLKPTYGRISRHGLIALASSFDQIGSFAKDVVSVAHLLRLMEGKDPKDATSANLSETTIDEFLQKDIKGMRIGIPKEYFLPGMDMEIKQAVMASVEIFEKHGAIIKEISLPHTSYALATYYLILFCEASSNLARLDGMRYGFSAAEESLTDVYEITRGQGFGAEVKRRIMLGTYALSKGYYDAYYKKALKVRTLIKKDFDEAFKDVDIIVSPTSPSVAWNLGEKFEDPLAMYLSDIYTVPINLSTVPAMSIPCGFSREGLPIGMQLIARPFNEQVLFQAGNFYQSVTDWHRKNAFS